MEIVSISPALGPRKRGIPRLPSDVGLRRESRLQEALTIHEFAKKILGKTRSIVLHPRVPSWVTV